VSGSVNETEEDGEYNSHSERVLNSLYSVLKEATVRIIQLLGDPNPSARIAALNAIARLAKYGR
jgi:hypothetical protein